MGGGYTRLPFLVWSRKTCAGSGIYGTGREKQWMLPSLNVLFGKVLTISFAVLDLLCVSCWLWYWCILHMSGCARQMTAAARGSSRLSHEELVYRIVVEGNTRYGLPPHGRPSLCVGYSRPAHHLVAGSTLVLLHRSYIHGIILVLLLCAEVQSYALVSRHASQIPRLLHQTL